MEEIRLNKYLSDAGVCSRREADRLIESGQVLVNGVPAVMGMKIDGTEEVVCRGVEVSGKKKERKILLAVNKPRGIVCTTSDKDRAENIVDFLHYPVRIYPIGRLDKDSSGLILMTNDGEIVNKILRGSNYHEKEYVVRVNQPLTGEFLDRMRSGVEILDTVTRPCKVEKTGGIYLPHHTHPGLKPPDTADVRRPGISGGISEAGENHEHPPGGSGFRGLPGDHRRGEKGAGASSGGFGQQAGRPGKKAAEA